MATIVSMNKLGTYFFIAYNSFKWIRLLCIDSIIEDDVHVGVVHVATIASIVAFMHCM